MLLIPVGATNIKIREVKASNNYLGKTMPLDMMNASTGAFSIMLF